MNPQSDPRTSLPQPVYQQFAVQAGQAGAQQAGPQPLHGAEAPATALTPNQIMEAIVARAKQLLDQPQSNPYNQSKGLQQLKAQYVYAKYHINLKVTQD